MNSLIYLDVINSSCTLLPSKGDVPLARSFHAACALDELMIIHGGEGLQAAASQAGQSADLGAEDSSSQVTSRPDGAEAPKYRVSQALEGICPGDSIQPNKVGANTRKVGEMFLFTSSVLLPRTKC